jgi:hypothetical protein
VGLFHWSIMGSFTEQQVFQAARERVGNKFEVSIGEAAIPDQALRSEMLECVIECCRIWATVGGQKETAFWTCASPALSTPAAPTLVASDSNGKLPAGAYQYRISAMYGNRETLAGPEAGVAATVNTNTGSVTVSWNAVLYATNYGVYGRTAGGEQLLRIVDGASTSWTDTGAVSSTCCGRGRIAPTGFWSPARWTR